MTLQIRGTQKPPLQHQTSISINGSSYNNTLGVPHASVAGVIGVPPADIGFNMIKDLIDFNADESSGDSSAEEKRSKKKRKEAALSPSGEKRANSLRKKASSQV
jgi:hypothetical protein